MEESPPDLRRLRETSSRPQRLPLRLLAGPAFLRQERRDSPRGFAQVPILLVIGRETFEDDDRVALRRPVLQAQDREAPYGGVRVARRKGVQERPVGVHGRRAVSREELERKQR